ncbi:hypothetical protein ACJ5NV_18470 [Loktanella agnita]|uniref:hypothetical protein n=1 Tax=Loktanella agnita TaxID=287097 RepID=UPI003988F305
MEFKKRTEQFAFAVGFATRAKTTQLDKAMSIFFARIGYQLTTEDVFEFAPYNNDLAQVVRGLRIYEKSKSEQLNVHLQDMFAEFFQLVADFEPPCSYDGRAFYIITTEGKMAMQCDRSMKVYALDGSQIDVEFERFAVKRDFIERYGNISVESWPYHQKLIVT